MEKNKKDPFIFGPYDPHADEPIEQPKFCAFCGDPFDSVGDFCSDNCTFQYYEEKDRHYEENEI